MCREHGQAHTRRQHTINEPVLASLMSHRHAALLITGAATVQTILVSAGVQGWICPLRHTLGVPCPGCGLSRAVAALFDGEWERAFTLHAFAPFLVLALLLITCAALLPARPRQALVAIVASVERRTAATGILLVGLVGYWLARLILTPHAFIHLING